MAVGSYGIVRPADVSPADVDIFYHYVSGRTANVTPTLTKLDSLGKIIDSMQSSVLGLMPIVTKNASDNQKNKEAIQAIIENKDKT